MTPLPLVVGIDPGLSGAIAILDTAGALHECHDMPTAGGLVDCSGLAAILSIAAQRPGSHVVIEDVHSMPGQGVASSFKFGRTMGAIEGVVATLELPRSYVSPAKWKKALGLSKDKGQSRRRAVETWPGTALAFARVKDDGRAEAALLAIWYLNEKGYGA